MTVNLTVPLTITNATRLVPSAVRIQDDDGDTSKHTVTVVWELRTAPAGSPADVVIARESVVIRNGMSDRLVRAAVPAGGDLSASLAVARGAVSTPTGATDAINVWRGPATAQGRRNALSTEGLAKGWIDANLTGT